MALQGRYRDVIRLLVVDVDHTLFDWLRTWALTYRTLLDETTRLTGVGREALLDELGALHRQAGSPEVPDPLARLPSLARWCGGDPRRTAAVQDVWRAAVATGDAALTAYAGVEALLDAVQAAGTPIVACSETAPDIVWRRLGRLGLERYLDALAVPCAPAAPGAMRLIATAAEKPQPEVLLRICEALGVMPRETTCVGDHLHKDVLMAQAAGVHDVWARYGTGRDPEDLALLDRLRHWSSPSVDIDRFGTAPVPSRTLETSLLELWDLFDFAPPG